MLLALRQQTWRDGHIRNYAIRSHMLSQCYNVEWLYGMAMVTTLKTLPINECRHMVMVSYR